MPRRVSTEAYDEEADEVRLSIPHLRDTHDSACRNEEAIRSYGLTRISPVLILLK